MPDIFGTNGNDNLVGTDGADVIYGYDGNDVIDGRSGPDVLNGGGGDDTFQFSSVTSQYPVQPVGKIDGGSGFDTLDLRFVSPVYFSMYYYDGITSQNVFNLTVGTQRFLLSSVENILLGSDSSDLNFSDVSYGLTINAGGGADRIVGTLYSDTLLGGSGNDTLIGNGGVDVLRGGDGNDTLQQQASRSGSPDANSYYGEAGDDSIVFSTPFSQSNAPALALIDGGEGSDVLIINGSSNGAIVDLVSGTLTASVYIYQGYPLQGSSKEVVLANIVSIENVEVNGGTIIGNNTSNKLTLTASGSIKAGLGSDVLTGSGANDSLYGEDGDDVITGGNGNDLIDGGNGADTISFESWRPGTESLPNVAVVVDLTAGIATSTVSGTDALTSIENVRGSEFSDVIVGNSDRNTLDGGSGDDLLTGGLGDDTLIGGLGSDVAIFGGSFSSYSFGLRNGALTVTGADGTDTISSVEKLKFDDLTVGVTPNGGLRVEGGAAAESLKGGEGPDTLIGGGGGDTLTGGLGSDTFLYAAASDSNASGRDLITDFETGVDRIDLSALKTTEISIIRDGASSYVFASSPGGGFQLQVNGALQASDIVYGYNHSIYVIGSNDADILIGSNQGDPIVGNGGDDTIIGGVGADALHGGAGRDTFVIRSAAESNAAGYDNYYDFTTGEDRLDLTALRTTAISVLRQTDGSSVVFGNSASGNFQFIAAGHAINGGDFVYGNNHSVYLIGSSVGETIIGSAYGDPIQGEGGDDILIGGLGADAIHGGAGRDTFVIRTAAESNATGYDNYYDFTTGEDRIDLTALDTTAISVLRQTDGSSVIFGNSASGDFQFIAAGRAINGGDFAYGNNHSVFLVGSAAGETLIGSNNADPILGGGGDDIVIGGGGADSLEGGAGRDTFRYRAASESTLAFSDRIQDFASGVDKIDLTGVRSGASDKYGIAYDGGGSFLYVDIGGDGTNDMLIQLKNVNLTAADINWDTGSKATSADYHSELFALTTEFEDGGLPGQPEWASRFTQVHFQEPQILDGFSSPSLDAHWLI